MVGRGRGGIENKEGIASGVKGESADKGPRDSGLQEKLLCQQSH